MNEVLSNRDSMTKFVKRLKEMPKGRSFVASVRRELEEAFMKEMERQKTLEQRRMLGMQKTDYQRRQEEQRIQQQHDQMLREQQHEQETIRQRDRQRIHER